MECVVQKTYLFGWLIILLLTSFCPGSQADHEPSCLELRDNCKNSLTCRAALRNLGECGNGLSGCLKNNSEACLDSLERVRKTFGLNSTCSCNVQKNKFDECIKFRTRIWLNPCETAFVEEVVQQITPTTTRVKKSSEQIQRWKKEFSQEIRPNPATLSTTTCTHALFELCLKHISCRELWKLFRQECAIDAQNNCHMTNRNDCWQSFEGISWTGLGNCTCQTNNSDCHWIRLQTNYNKCIYEITSSGQVPNAVSVKVQLPVEPTTPVVPFWATSSSPATQQTHTQQSYNQQSQHYTYQNQLSTNWTATPTQTSQQTTLNLQQQEYYKELARRQEEEQKQRELERQEYDRRMREYDERKKQWEAQARQQTSYYTTAQTSLATQLTTTSTHKPYLRATYSSTVPQTSSYTSSLNDTSVTYRLNGTPYYRRNITYTTVPTNAPIIPSSSTTTRKPKTHRPKTTTPTTTSTTSTTPSTTTTTEPTTTEAQTTTQKPQHQARPPVHFARKPTTTEMPTTTTSEPTDQSKSSEAAKSTDSAEESTDSSLNEEELQTSKHRTVEELEEHDGVLVNRWQLPTNKSDDAESTCADAHSKCEADDTCRWHISELQMKCNKPNNECQRSQCAGAMRRFSRYVNKSLLESMMFCQCSFSDVNCKHQQALMYPRCLYDLGNEKPNYSCTQQLMLCQHDSYCARSLNALNNSCPLVGKAGSCVAKDFGECRLALIGVRGTELESPCYCNKNDEKCAEFQNMVLPSHACVEDSMIDFVAGGSIATASDRQLPKIKSTKSHSSTRRNQKKLKNQNQTSTSTSTTSTTTTVAPFSEKSELDENEEDSEIVSTEDTSTDEIEDDLDVQESDNVTTTSKPSKLASTLPSEIRTKIGGKGIKISKGSTPKIINEAPVTKAPAPPREGGCPSRNIEGDKITHYKNSVFRQYNDLAGRCSSYCECSDKEKATCSPLSCLPEGTCTTSQTKVVFGERLFIEGRGACLCHSDGKFICDSAEGVIELDPGIYISLGFSREELKMLKEKVPKPLLEKCGLVSPDISVQNDIASRLQFALERVLPKDMLCRLALIERYSREDTMLLQIQWYGVDTYSNTTKDKDAHWHVGKLEKVCAPFVRKLEYQFMLERAARYQLVLSTVKQLRVYELLDGLVVSNSAHSLLFHCHFSLLLSMFLLLIANAQLNRIPNDLIHNLVP